MDDLAVPLFQESPLGIPNIPWYSNPRSGRMLTQKQAWDCDHNGFVTCQWQFWGKEYFKQYILRQTHIEDDLISYYPTAPAPRWSIRRQKSDRVQ